MWKASDLWSRGERSALAVRGAVGRVPSPVYRATAVVLISLLGGWLALAVAGTVSVPVGPVAARMSLVPALTGDTVVRVPPLGTLWLDTHDGPLGLRAEVARVRVTDTRQVVDELDDGAALQDEVVGDLRSGVATLVVRSTLVVTVGVALLGLLAFRRVRPAAAATGLSLALIGVGGGVAAATWNPRAVLEPRYSGLLASAPSVVGNVEDIVTNFGSYSAELARLTTNVARLYDTTASLPVFQPGQATVRVLHVSDLHLNPASWEVIRAVVTQFKIDLVADSGDLTDHGSAVEDRYAKPIGTLGVPYVFVRGNHDSAETQRAVGTQPNATVLTGKTVVVRGIRFIGAGDPRFTPDRSVPAPGEDAVRSAGEALARAAAATRPTPDVAVVHDPAAAGPLDGTVPLVLAGHTHRRSTRVLAGGTRLFVQGSTGGAGLRALQGAAPTPIECSVLYLDRSTKALRAWDDITLGGLGLASAQISRHVPDAAGPAGR